MSRTLQIKRGNNANLSSLTLLAGEPAIVLDTGKFYVGNGSNNVLINPDNAPSADKLTTARSITLTGDVTGSATFDGSANITIAATEATTGVTAGTYPKVTVDTKGRITSGSTLSANDIPSITASKVVDFDSQVRTSTLNQMTAPTADLSINSHKITNVTDPTNAQDAATKNYVDAARAGLSVKDPVRVATTVNLSATYASNILTASANGSISIDGVTLALNDRVLVKNQTTATQNGIYYVTQLGDASNPWKLTRTNDANMSSEITAGMATWVNEGTTNSDGRWVLITNNPITLDTTSLAFTKDFQASDIVAGTGISKSGNTISLANSGATAGTYKSVTVDVTGRVTGGTNPTNLSGYGITDAVYSSDVVTIATASKILKLDSNGNLPTSITGNAATATKLATAITINGITFDGSSSITIPADATAIDGGTF